MARRARPRATAVVTRRATTSPRRNRHRCAARRDAGRSSRADGAKRRAELSAPRDNPAYDGAPALRFAMRPGATLDPRGWTHQRRIVVADSADGLTRLRLAPPDLVPARADLGDVRIVDAQQQQWPYLLQPDAARSWQALGADAPKRERGTSTYEMRLPVTPMAVDQLLLDGDAAFVDRAFRLRGHTAAGVDVPLADGRLTIRGERPEPLTIGFPAQRLTALELQVDDGDESALSWRAVRARAVEPELFLVAGRRLHAADRQPGRGAAALRARARARRRARGPRRQRGCRAAGGQPALFARRAPRDRRSSRRTAATAGPVDVLPPPWSCGIVTLRTAPVRASQAQSTTDYTDAVLSASSVAGTPHGQGDAAAGEVDLDDAYADHVAGLHHGARVADEMIGERGDVHETVLVHADVDEGPEVRDVGHHALELHAGLQILEPRDALAEGGGAELRPRVAPRLFQLGPGCRARSGRRSVGRRIPSARRPRR
jgi:hypothetical protein